MYVLVLGGTGTMGQAVARDLIKQKQVKKVTIGSRSADPERLHSTLRTSEKVSLSRVDVNDRAGLVRAIKDVDIVINCVGPFYKTGPKVASVAIEARVNYVDICDDYDAVSQIFAPEIDNGAKEAGITILTGMGSDPGTSNIIAKHYANQLDRVEEISFFWAISIADFEEGAVWDHCLHMNSGLIPQYLDGSLVLVPAGSGEETTEFIDPLGKCVVHYVGHPQPITVPRYIEGVKTVVSKGALLPPWVDQLIKEQAESDFLSEEPIEVKGVQVAPYDLTLKLWRTIPNNRDVGSVASGIKVIVKGERKGKKVIYTCDMVGKTAPGTGIPASISAQMLYSGDIKAKGVLAPEGCIPPEKYFAEFVKRGAKMYQTEVTSCMLTSPV